VLQSRLEHTLAELPTKWRKLGALNALVGVFLSALISLCLPSIAVTDYRALEVMDTSELKSLDGLLERERAIVIERRAIAKAEQRKVLRVDCDLDIKRIDRIQTWLQNIYKDSRRTW
jgi:hypothetical protein